MDIVSKLYSINIKTVLLLLFIECLLKDQSIKDRYSIIIKKNKSQIVNFIYNLYLKHNNRLNNIDIIILVGKLVEYSYYVCIVFK